jgi:hypothetical protein
MRASVGMKADHGESGSGTVRPDRHAGAGDPLFGMHVGEPGPGQTRWNDQDLPQRLRTMKDQGDTGRGDRTAHLMLTEQSGAKRKVPQAVHRRCDDRGRAGHAPSRLPVASDQGGQAAHGRRPVEGRQAGLAPRGVVACSPRPQRTWPAATGSSLAPTRYSGGPSPRCSTPAGFSMQQTGGCLLAMRAAALTMTVSGPRLGMA